MVETERRVFDRFNARFPTKFKDSRIGYGSEVQLRDVSASGARLITKERMFLDDPVSLEVEIPDGGSPLLLRGKVVWSKPVNVMWQVGVQFTKVEFIKLSRLYKYTLQE